MKKLFDYFYDEIDFKEIFKHPSRWFGYSFLLFFIVIFASGIVFLNNLDNFYKNTTPYDEPDSAKLFKDVELRLGKKVEGVKLEEIKNPTQEMLARGQELYRTTCQTCHGESGKGDGIAGKGLNPPPRNFTKSDGWKNGRTITAVYKTLQEGIPGSGMTAYDFLSPRDRIALYHTIRKFASDFPPLTDKDIAELDAAFRVTQSYELPANIPIGKAMEKLIAENNPKVLRAQAIASALAKSEFSRYVSDPKAFASFLLNVQNQGGILDLMISNIPRNGLSPKFIAATENEKKEFTNKVLSLSMN
jgi:mono/diheme cytochrome c family protein